MASIAIDIAPLPKPNEDKHYELLYHGEDCADIDSSVLLCFQKDRIRRPGIFRFTELDEAAARALPEWNDLKLARDKLIDGYGNVLERCKFLLSCDRNGTDSPSRIPNIKFAKLVLGDDVH